MERSCKYDEATTQQDGVRLKTAAGVVERGKLKRTKGHQDSADFAAAGRPPVTQPE